MSKQVKSFQLKELMTFHFQVYFLKYSCTSCKRSFSKEPVIKADPSFFSENFFCVVCLDWHHHLHHHHHHHHHCDWPVSSNWDKHQVKNGSRTSKNVTCLIMIKLLPLSIFWYNIWIKERIGIVEAEQARTSHVWSWPWSLWWSWRYW